MERAETETVLFNNDGSEIVLSEQQADYVNFENQNTSLVVKGIAGAGKSVVLIGKAMKLLNAYEPGVNNRILLVSYTNSLVNYAKERLDPDGSKSHFIRISTMDSLIDEISKSMDFIDRPKGSIIQKEDNRRVIEQILARHGLSSNHRFYRNPKDVEIQDFWIDEFEWMMGWGIDGSDQERYLTILRRGRKMYRMNVADRVEAFKLYRDYLDRLEKRCVWAMIGLFVYKHIQDIPSKFRYDYVLIDEAQDFTFVKMMIAIGLSRKSVGIAMDANQRIYQNYWKLKDLGIKSYSRGLNKSFRCTKQIDRFADVLRQNNLKNLDQDEKNEHVEPEREGSLPVVVKTEDLADQERLIKTIIQSRKQNTSLAVLFYSRWEIERFSSILSKEGIYHECIMGKSDNQSSERTYSVTGAGVKLCTIHSSKGLEFDTIVIPFFNYGKYPTKYKNDKMEDFSEEDHINQFRNLTYVAMTRARKRLFVTYYQKPSMFLDEIDEKAGGRPEPGCSNNLYSYQTSNSLYSSSEPNSCFDSSTKQHPDRHYEPVLYIRPKGSADDGSTPAELMRRYSITAELKTVLGKNHQIPPDSILFKNQDECIKQLKDLASEGHLVAQYNLALCYFQGVAVRKDVNKTVGLLREAADNGLREARDMLTTEKFGEFTNVLSRSNVEFLAKLGNRAYRKKYADMAENFKHSSLRARLYIELAEGGCVDAEYELAWIAEMGLGGFVRQNPDYARYWYHRYYEETGQNKAKIALERLGDGPMSDIVPDMLPLDKKDTVWFTHDVWRPSRELPDMNKLTSKEEHESKNGTSPVDITQYLESKDIKFKDNRDGDGNLWVAGSEQLVSNASELQNMGYTLVNFSATIGKKKAKWFKIKFPE